MPFHYFGYGSNMDLTSLRAKGVEPRWSVPAELPGWRLRFNVRHWFRHEGGMATVEPSSAPGDRVLGVLHLCDDQHLARLDAVEAYGTGYDRILVQVETPAGSVQAVAYQGLPSVLDASRLPTRRYINILVRGAERAGIDAAYIERLRHHPVHPPWDYPTFTPPAGDYPDFDDAALAAHPLHTALCDFVFDMSAARPALEALKPLLGGKDGTLFHLKRLDTSDGTETIEDVRQDRISEQGRIYLNAYLSEYAREFRYAGRLRVSFASGPLGRPTSA